MKTTTKIRFTIAMMLLFSAFLTQAQSKLNLQKEGLELKIEGTSTLHDWHMTSTEATGFVMFKSDEQIPGFSSGEVTFEAETLKSGKRGMDKNAYKALNTSDFPKVRFVLKNCNMESAKKGTAEGQLTIAGTTRDVTFEITLNQNGQQISVHGATAFKLTNFNVEPPTAMLGAIKTGNDVTIEFKSTFQK